MHHDKPRNFETIQNLAAAWRAVSLKQDKPIARTACVLMAKRLDALYDDIVATLDASLELKEDIEEETGDTL